MEVISADRLRDYKVSAAETTKIPTAQMSNNETGTCVISEELWDCNLKELSRMRRVLRWWTAVRGSPHVDTVRDEEAEILMLLVGGPGVLVDERVIIVIVLIISVLLLLFSKSRR